MGTVTRSKMFLTFMLLYFSFVPILSREINAMQEEPGYYCRYNNDYQTCLRYPDEEKPITVTKTACACDNIALKDKNGKLVGGPECESKDQFGHKYCFVDEETAKYCNDETNIYDYNTYGFNEDE